MTNAEFYDNIRRLAGEKGLSLYQLQRMCEEIPESTFFTMFQKKSIPKLDYSMDAPLHFEITVPNRTALVLRYYVEVDKDTVPPSTTSFYISNNVELTGGLQSHNVISFKDEKAVGGINSDRLRIIKKDAEFVLGLISASFLYLYI